MSRSEYAARLLAPIWQGFFVAELIAREVQKELEATAKDRLMMREYAELLEASDYLKRRGLEFDSIGLVTALQSIGGKVYIWPWDGDLSEAFTQAIREMLAKNPNLQSRAEAAGMGLSSLDKLSRDIAQHNENVRRLQEREEAQASA